MRERGWSVEALVRDPDADQAIALAEMGCTLVRGDVTQAEDLAALMSHADDVVHNAGVYELGGRKSTIERMRSVNVAGTRHVSEAAKAADFAKTVYVSSVVAIDPALHEPAETRPVEDRSTRGRARVPGSRAPTGHSDAQTAWWDQTTTRHSAFGIRHSAFGIRLLAAIAHPEAVPTDIGRGRLPSRPGTRRCSCRRHLPCGRTRPSRGRLCVQRGKRAFLGVVPRVRTPTRRDEGSRVHASMVHATADGPVRSSAPPRGAISVSVPGSRGPVTR
jgi:hypothetical protein